MHADELVGPLGGGGNVGDGDGGGIGGQNGLRLTDAVQLRKDALFDVKVFNRRLNNQIGVGGQLQIGGKGNLVNDGLLTGLIQLTLGHQLVQALVQTGLGGLNDLVLDVAHNHVEPLAGKHLRNIQAHRAAADYNNLFHGYIPP